MPPVLPRERSLPGPFDAETLILSGDLDFSTPAEYARDDLLPLLSRGRQVVLRGRGHVNDLIGDGAEDGRAAVDRFLASGHAPGLSASGPSVEPPVVDKIAGFEPSIVQGRKTVATQALSFIVDRGSGTTAERSL